MKFFSRKIRNVFEMVRFSHAVFALPFAVVCLLVALQGLPSAWFLFRIVAAVLCARNVAMTFNRLADVRFDRENPRTRNRHLVTGSVSYRFAWLFLLANALVFVGLASTFNTLAAWLSLPTLAWLCLYSLTKRFTAWSHFFLGSSLALAPMGAWVAATGQISVLPALLAGAVLLWVAGFDMIYATQDETFDRTHGLHSMVVALGRPGALWLARACHGLMLPFLVAFALQARPTLGRYFLLSCVVIAGLLIWEHRLVRPNGDLQRLNDAFFRVNGLISVLLLAATVADLLF